MKFAGGNLVEAIDEAARRLEDDRVVERIWAKDHTVWKPEPTEIVNRLGWLDIADRMEPHLGALRDFAADVKARGVRHVVLLGMGGSSLGAEVLRGVAGSRDPEWPRLWVLDTTVPSWVGRVTESIDLDTTLFVVASKSGGTTEVMALFHHFWGLCPDGERFVAVTDPGSPLAEMAEARGFYRTFVNDPDIGGRYSVLSYFGLVCGALIGADLDGIVASAKAAAARCRAASSNENPGALLGTIFGVAARVGRDKISLLATPGLEVLGLWIEQLVAESTGKQGTGALPIATEPLVAADRYSADRVFVALRLAGDDPTVVDALTEDLTALQHPVIRIDVDGPAALGRVFYEFEFATAVAGHLLGIQPFDQPNVQESKDNTKRVLASYERDGALPAVEVGDPAAFGAMLNAADPGAYVALMAYTDETPLIEERIAALRRVILEKRRLPTTFGYGPRFLHSTGQLHKGDGGHGIFVQLTEPAATDIPVPEKPYSFGILAAAQAIGDLEALAAHGRVHLSVDLGSDPAAAIEALIAQV